MGMSAILIVREHTVYIQSSNRTPNSEQVLTDLHSRVHGEKRRGTKDGLAEQVPAATVLYQYCTILRLVIGMAWSFSYNKRIRLLQIIAQANDVR